MNVRGIGLFLLLGFLGQSMSFANPPLDLVESVDLERYQGRWYEIALLPNRFQRRCVSDTSARYELMDDGRIRVINRCLQADGSWAEVEGVARLADRDGPSSALEVRFAPRWLSFLPFVWGDYRVLALGDDYDYAMVGSENRRYLWILARDTRLAPERLEQLRGEASRQGFDIDRLQMTPHTADDS